MRLGRGVGLPLAGVLLVVVLCGTVIQRLRPPLTERLADAEGSRDDLYVLPSPDRLVAMSLGYRAALADLLWGHVLVWSGLAFSEKRRFADAGEYLDAINALDPTFRDPYLHADLVLTFQAIPTPRDDYYKAREILERGVANRPSDSDLWLQLGQFVGSLAPAHLATLDDEETAQAWEADGARYVARACELGANDPEISRFCALATHLYAKLGKDQALESFLERMVALTDSPEVKEQALVSLWRLRGKRASNEARERSWALEALRDSDLPFVSRALYSALAPPFSTWNCAGLRGGSDRRDDCATQWGPYLAERAAPAAPDAPDAPDAPGK